MRIWSIHPEYLDAKGLVALWREALLARHVLEGLTRGYTHHPQLIRFRDAADPVGSINRYLSEVRAEALRRGYRFDESKIGPFEPSVQLTVTRGQMEYETAHLHGKLKTRDPRRYEEIVTLGELRPHPLFRVVNGDIEKWEKQ